MNVSRKSPKHENTPTLPETIKGHHVYDVAVHVDTREINLVQQWVPHAITAENLIIMHAYAWENRRNNLNRTIKHVKKQRKLVDAKIANDEPTRNMILLNDTPAQGTLTDRTMARITKAMTATKAATTIATCTI